MTRQQFLCRLGFHKQVVNNRNLVCFHCHKVIARWARP